MTNIFAGLGSGLALENASMSPPGSGVRFAPHRYQGGFFPQRSKSVDNISLQDAGDLGLLRSNRPRERNGFSILSPFTYGGIQDPD